MTTHMTSRPRIDHHPRDDWNGSHIARHAVLPQEADEVVTGETMVRETYKGRLQLVEPTAADRTLSIRVGPVPDQPGSDDVFSARPASRKERDSYAQVKGGPTR